MSDHLRPEALIPQFGMHKLSQRRLSHLDPAIKSVPGCQLIHLLTIACIIASMETLGATTAPGPHCIISQYQSCNSRGEPAHALAKLLNVCLLLRKRSPTAPSLRLLHHQLPACSCNQSQAVIPASLANNTRPSNCSSAAHIPSARPLSYTSKRALTLHTSPFAAYNVTETSARVERAPVWTMQINGTLRGIIADAVNVQMSPVDVRGSYRDCLCGCGKLLA